MEDDWHIFFQYHESSDARQAAGLESVVAPRLQQFMTVHDVIKSICKGEDFDTAGRFAMLIWVLWNNRNNMVWNGSKEVGNNLGIKACLLWKEWKSVQQYQQSRQHSDQQQHAITWQKPPVGWHKCNVDAGFHQEHNKTSVGWVLRNSVGHFAAAGTRWKAGVCSILEGEALALLEAMRDVEDRGITHVIFEFDSKSVVDAVHNLRAGSSEFSSIICKIKIVRLQNPNFKVKFIKHKRI